MNEKLLMSFGLSQNTARAYRALVLKKSLRPSQLAKLTGESRSNCYALLDRLVGLGLATKTDENKKFTYYPTSPVALKTLLDQKLEEVEQQLQTLDKRLPQMISEYHTGGDQPRVTHYKGKKELETMYVQQMEQSGRELYFIRSKADIPYFGLKVMESLRRLAPKYKKRRFGITPILVNAPSDARKDAAAGGLKRAWIKGEEYTAPVEWAVAGNTVQAILLKDEGYGVSINHPEIAESFRQIMKLLYDYIQKSPDYKKLPKFK
ncbi:MAG TPA: helix-turn-helix domain-containing protein [Candidatus Saccharimonadales bacterium]